MAALATTAALRATIALPLLPEVGNRRAKDAIAYFGSAEEAMAASKEDWMAGGHMSLLQGQVLQDAKAEVLRRADEELAFIDSHNIQPFYFEDEAYPYRLAECPDCPLLLYGLGALAPNKGKMLSVVGTRMPTDMGRQLCHDLVVDLAKKVPDLTIISGLAYGIDVTAHMAALEAGIPTIIIPGHGLDKIYPHQHREVARQALFKGGILTEYMSKTEPLPPNFVARNRIIAGMADAVVVVESKAKGGSLITANMALDYGRELFAFPGRPRMVSSAGCNALIRDSKAMLIEGADDVIAAMNWQPRGSQVVETTLDQMFLELAPEEEAVMNLLRTAENGMHANSLVSELKMPYLPLLNLLQQMSLRGLLKALPGGMYRALC